jgi:hypothetical protein
MSLENYLTIIEIGLAAARAAGASGDKLAVIASLEKIVRGGMDAYQEVKGQPLDLSKLKPIELL